MIGGIIKRANARRNRRERPFEQKPVGRTVNIAAGMVSEGRERRPIYRAVSGA